MLLFKISASFCLLPDTDDESCMCDPCLNHGSCMKLDDGYICLCLDHYHGKYCEKHGDRRHPHNNSNYLHCEYVLKRKHNYFHRLSDRLIVGGFVSLKCLNRLNCSVSKYI